MGWHWLIKWYRFQEYNSIIHHLYIELCVHLLKSSLLPSPFILPFPSSTSPQPLPSGNHHTVVCVYEFGGFFGFVFVLFVCLFLLSPSLFSPSPQKTIFVQLISSTLLAVVKNNGRIRETWMRSSYASESPESGYMPPTHYPAPSSQFPHQRLDLGWTPDFVLVKRTSLYFLVK